jgi:hypothetical protein
MLTAPATTTTQQIITTTPEPENTGASSHAQLPTPPMAHAMLPTQPLKLRLRSRRPDNYNNNHGAGSGSGDVTLGRRRIVKRSPPRGALKRRRADYDDMDSDMDISSSSSDRDVDASGPRTPKRARIAPEVMPLGLDRSDFHRLQELEDEAAALEDEEPSAATTRHVNAEENGQGEVEADGEEWSTEDDRVLVELVLEKLKLTKTDWQECARSLGKDRMSIGRRWKSLMVNGDVGLKSRSRRGKIHGTWR